MNSRKNNVSLGLFGLESLPSNPTQCLASAASAPTLALENSALRDHLRVCNGSSHHAFALYCALQTIHQFYVRRFVTTLAILVLLIGTAYMVL